MILIQNGTWVNINADSKMAKFYKFGQTSIEFKTIKKLR